MEDEVLGEPEAREGLAPLRGIVPQRAVLTELARGFLLAQETDPGQARRFAASFLKERSGGASRNDRIVPFQRVPAVRRGVSDALREG